MAVVGPSFILMKVCFLACKEGTQFGDVTEDRMQSLFYRRSGPIAASISIVVEQLTVAS